MKFRDYLIKANACRDAQSFVGDKTFKQAWESANRPDWMIWLMQQVNYQDDQMYRLFSCWCAANTPLADGRVTWDLLTDNRSRKAILVSIDYANGDATQEDLAAARDAAWAVARDVAWDVAWAAAWAASWAASWAGDAARDAARDVAWAAAWAAAWAGDAARDAARDAVRDAARASQAKELRRRVDFRKLERLVQKAMR